MQHVCIKDRPDIDLYGDKTATDKSRCPPPEPSQLKVDQLLMNVEASSMNVVDDLWWKECQAPCPKNDEPSSDTKALLWLVIV